MILGQRRVKILEKFDKKNIYILDDTLSGTDVADIGENVYLVFEIIS